MRTIGRSLAIIGVTVLTLSSPGRGACGPGLVSCEPSAEDARAKIERLLDSAFATPHSIVSLEKLDGRRVETPDRKVYELRFWAVVSYSDDQLLCRMKHCPELHNYLVEIDKTAKKATIAGWLFFEPAEQGWR